MRASRKNQSGLSLVELLLVVTAVMVLAIFAYKRMEKREDAARDAAAQAVATAKARDEQLCDISSEYCTDEQRAERAQGQRRQHR